MLTRCLVDIAAAMDVCLQLVETFGSTRDDWMAEDLQAWLHQNGIYEGLPEILQHGIQNDELYIVTTKQVKPDLICTDHIYLQDNITNPPACAGRWLVSH